MHSTRWSLGSDPVPPETFHSSQTQPNNQPFSACERSRPLTHTPAPFMYPYLPYPLANPTSTATTLFSPPSPTSPPQLYHPNVQNSRTWPSPARTTGQGQGLWAAARDRSAGGVSAGGKREEDGGGTRRGGQGVGDLVPRSQRQSKGKTLTGRRRCCETSGRAQFCTSGGDLGIGALPGCARTVAQRERGNIRE